MRFTVSTRGARSTATSSRRPAPFAFGWHAAGAVGSAPRSRPGALSEGAQKSASTRRFAMSTPTSRTGISPLSEDMLRRLRPRPRPRRAPSWSKQQQLAVVDVMSALAPVSSGNCRRRPTTLEGVARVDVSSPISSSSTGAAADKDRPFAHLEKSSSCRLSCICTRSSMHRWNSTNSRFIASRSSSKAPASESDAFCFSSASWPPPFESLPSPTAWPFIRSLCWMPAS
mmetsp:Transcript_59226/g.155977  ORF Transcript_59226/g.155977 Transcript_59226/m.155977 type:complete len:228 (+) Transcript_59226:1084-1767(+)